ncbi:MAG: hypothetical protein AAGF47_11990, partial [Planctomycetota bacterium]
GGGRRGGRAPSPRRGAVGPPPPRAPPGPGPREHTEPGLSTNDAEHPVVRQALETFNGRILDIKPVRKKPDHQ